MISVQLDTREFTRWLSVQMQRQVPYATARALTALAKYAQEDVRAGIRESMTIRRPWVLKGIAVQAAQKRDGLAGMKAEVGSRDWYMSDQLADRPSVRESKSGGKQFLPKAARRSKPANISKAMRPATVTQRALSGEGKLFFKRGRGGRGILFQKLRGDRLRILYTLGDQQTIRPQLSLRQVVTRTVMQRGEQEFIRQLQAAIKSKR